MDVQQALDAPRFRHWRANSVMFETAVPESTIDELQSMGHRRPNEPRILGEERRIHTDGKCEATDTQL